MSKKKQLNKDTFIEKGGIIHLNTNVNNRKGCVGRRIRIELEKQDTLLQQEDGTVGVGTVMSAGPDVSTCKVGDRIAFTYWAKDKVQVEKYGETKEMIYLLATDQFICEIL